jgi:hypothetical protein
MQPSRPCGPPFPLRPSSDAVRCSPRLPPPPCPPVRFQTHHHLPPTQPYLALPFPCTGAAAPRRIRSVHRHPTALGESRHYTIFPSFFDVVCPSPPYLSLRAVGCTPTRRRPSQEPRRHQAPPHQAVALPHRRQGSWVSLHRPHLFRRTHGVPVVLEPPPSKHLVPGSFIGNRAAAVTLRAVTVAWAHSRRVPRPAGLPTQPWAARWSRVA